MKEKKIKTICLILVTIAIVVSAVFYSWSILKRQAYYDELEATDRQRERMKECKDVGSKAITEYEKSSPNVTFYYSPYFTFNEKLNTCLYSGGSFDYDPLTGSVSERFIKNAYTNEIIDSFYSFTEKGGEKTGEKDKNEEIERFYETHDRLFGTSFKVTK